MLLKPNERIRDFTKFKSRIQIGEGLFFSLRAFSLLIAAEVPFYLLLKCVL